MSYHIDIQNAATDPIPVDNQNLIVWITEALSQHLPDAELTLRLVDKEEMVELNTTYRQQAKPTNVLSFPFSMPKDVSLDCPLLGDIVICPAVLVEESLSWERSLESHWAHIVVHGVLHLLGYDHMEPEETLTMQAQEITILSNLGYANPYNTEDFDFEQK